MEKDVKESETTLRSVLAACPVGIALSTPERVISLLNDSMAAAIGYLPEELTGKSIRRFYPTDAEYVRVGEAVNRAAREGRVAIIETKWVHRDGSLRDILLHVVAKDQNDPGAGFVFSCMDITERKEMETALRKSEEKYRNICERAIEGFFQATPGGRLVSANLAIARMHGFESPADIIESINDKRFRLFAHLEDWNRFEDAMTTFGYTEALEVEGRRKDGSLMWVSINARRVDDAATGEIHYEGTVEDITPRKMAELELRESEKRYRSLFETANDAIFLVRNSDAVFVDCNSKATEMFRCAREDFIGRSSRDFEVPVQDDGGNTEEVIERHVAAALSGEPQFFEWKHRRADGTFFDAEVSLGALKIDKQQYILSITRDITDRKRSEEMLGNVLSELETRNVELANANREIRESQKKIIQQEKMASIGQLAAGVAHEINNPMGFIISNLNSLHKYMKKIPEFIKAQTEAIEGLAQPKTPERESVLEAAAQARRRLKIDYLLEDSENLISESLEGADRVKRIVQDLKSFSRADSGEYMPADVNEIIESTLNIVWNELKYKATVTKEYGELPRVRCNPRQLSQVFMNILVNAAQAIPESGMITIRTGQDRLGVHVAIADTGAGVPEDHLHRIFEPFFTTKEVGAGTGLGLSIAYDIIKKHKGEIDVESAVGRGTTFTVTLPAEGHQNG
jgi:PAS domain S-box-containing protein